MKAKTRTLRLPFPALLCGLAVIAVVILWLDWDISYIADKPLGFFLVGITGAIFANSTGAGGGVVFIPVFHQMGLSELQSVSTSFGIQCFGMTAGAITWFRYYRSQNYHDANSSDSPNPGLWKSFAKIVLLCSLFSIMGLWTNHALKMVSPATLHQLFSWFSVCLGISILSITFLFKVKQVRIILKPFDLIFLTLISYGGGIITAWLSVGVGEIVAFYLIFRRFDATVSIAAAVAISAITVWAAAPQHLWLNSTANWQIITFAGPGALIGGVLAKALVNMMSARRLKIFFGFWLLFIGLYS